jgi:hypothetical protein
MREEVMKFRFLPLLTLPNCTGNRSANAPAVYTTTQTEEEVPLSGHTVSESACCSPRREFNLYPGTGQNPRRL